MTTSRTLRNLVLATAFAVVGAPAWAAPDAALAADLESTLRAPKSLATAGQAHHASRRPIYARFADNRAYPCPDRWYFAQMPLIVGIAY